MSDSPEEVAEVVEYASVVLLHREIVRHGQVRLTPRDFSDYEENIASGLQGIQLNEDNGDILLSHTHADSGQPVM